MENDRITTLLQKNKDMKNANSETQYLPTKLVNFTYISDWRKTEFSSIIMRHTQQDIELYDMIYQLFLEKCYIKIESISGSRTQFTFKFMNNFCTIHDSYPGISRSNKNFCWITRRILRRCKSSEYAFLT